MNPAAVVRAHAGPRFSDDSTLILPTGQEPVSRSLRRAAVSGWLPGPGESNTVRSDGGHRPPRSFPLPEPGLLVLRRAATWSAAVPVPLN